MTKGSKLTKLYYLKELQKKYGLRTQKKYGQNFLLSQAVLDDIVQAADLGPDDVVVEIGPGMGALTQALARAAGRVLAVEIDKGLERLLKETVPEENVDFLFADVLSLDLAQEVFSRYGKSSYTLVANLPYYVTSPIITSLLEAEAGPSRMVVMVQKEVAERMVSAPGPKSYGALSVLVQYHAKASLVRPVDRKLFYPVPGVDSSIVRLDMRTRPPVSVNDEAFFFRLVRAAFIHRRKTLVNALSMQLADFSKEQVRQALKGLDIDPKRRGETLSLQDFADLSLALVKKIEKD